MVGTEKTADYKSAGTWKSADCKSAETSCKQPRQRRNETKNGGPEQVLYRDGGVSERQKRG